jgi:single-strand DNA-binding protein
MNMVALVGNVASKPEVRETATGRTCCTFRLAVSRIGGTQADFLTVVAWERQAEICGKYIDIGRRIGVEGRLHHTTWKADDGSPRSRVEVIASRVELMGRSNRERNEPEPVHPIDEAAADEAAANEASAGEHEASSEHDDVFGITEERPSSAFERVPELV